MPCWLSIELSRAIMLSSQSPGQHHSNQLKPVARLLQTHVAQGMRRSSDDIVLHLSERMQAQVKSISSCLATFALREGISNLDFQHTSQAVRLKLEKKSVALSCSLFCSSKVSEDDFERALFYFSSSMSLSGSVLKTPRKAQTSQGRQRE